MCTSELALWRIEKLRQHYATKYVVRDAKDIFVLAFINQEVERNPEKVNEHYVHFLVGLMLGEIDLPPYVNDEYFKLPKAFRIFATAD